MPRWTNAYLNGSSTAASLSGNRNHSQMSLAVSGQGDQDRVAVAERGKLKNIPK
jgi:hypothetical protein